MAYSFTNVDLQNVCVFSFFSFVCALWYVHYCVYRLSYCSKHFLVEIFLITLKNRDRLLISVGNLFSLQSECFFLILYLYNVTELLTQWMQVISIIYLLYSLLDSLYQYEFFFIIECLINRHDKE